MVSRSLALIAALRESLGIVFFIVGEKGGYLLVRPGHLAVFYCGTGCHADQCDRVSWHALGDALDAQGRVDDTLTSYLYAFRLDPVDRAAASSATYLLAIRGLSGWRHDARFAMVPFVADLSDNAAFRAIRQRIAEDTAFQRELLQPDEALMAAVGIEE